MPFQIYPFLSAFLGGILPALLWLWFWRKEDKKRPEPRGMIARAFISGMIAVPLVIPFEKAVNVLTESPILTIALWATIEEIFKYAAALVSVLKSKAVDEPLDPLIYMISIALGFAALENVFFLLGPLTNGNALESVTTGSMRFVGATLLHVASSASVGAAFSLSYYKRAALKRRYLYTGVFIAIVLHSVFNLLIMKSGESGILPSLIFVWVLIIALIILFEKIKRIRPAASPS